MEIACAVLNRNMFPVVILLARSVKAVTDVCVTDTYKISSPRLGEVHGACTST